MSYDSISRRASDVRRRADAAAARVGRSADDIEILPITKAHPIAALEAVRSAGFDRIGENRVREAEEKRAAVGGLGLAWHMVGHLQRNKAQGAVRTFDVVESVDSVRLARRLDAEVTKAGRAPLTVLAQVNVSGEANKSGFAPDSVVDAVGEMLALGGLRVDGLMTMAPFTADEPVLRRTFQGARALSDACRGAFGEAFGRTLSMGMSNDFEIAIEEGSTRVRLGTVLLGERPPR